MVGGEPGVQVFGDEAGCAARAAILRNKNGERFP